MLSQEPEPTRWHWIFSPVRLTRELHVWHGRYLILLVNWPVVLVMNPLSSVSPVRAGVPLGVMVHQALRAMGKQSFHYGISIIRDRVLMLRRLILSNHAMVLVA